MSWEEMESGEDTSNQAANVREKQAELAKAYRRAFSTDDGKKVLDDMMQRFVMGNDVSLSAQNIDYEAAYRNGEAGVVKFVINQFNRAEIL